MKGRIKNLILSILSQDMAKQARQVEIATLIVFALLLLTVWWLWQFQIDITVPVEEGREVVARMNIFELLLSKK
jgi:hypothetical protein